MNLVHNRERRGITLTIDKCYVNLLLIGRSKDRSYLANFNLHNTVYDKNIM